MGVTTEARAPARRSGPLVRAAGRRTFGSGTWSALVLGSFVLLGAATAGGPVFAEAVSGAALHDQLAAVPPGAPVERAAAVGLSGGSGPQDPLVAPLAEQLGSLPGASAPVWSGVSITAQLTGFQQGQLVVDAGGARQRVVLAAVEDPAARLDVAAPPGAPPQGAADGGLAVWLPEPTAQALGAATGDDIAISLSGGSADPPPAPVTATVAGTYALGGDGLPADPRGNGWWSDVPGLPTGPGASPLLVTGTTTGADLAARTGDVVLWSATSSLAPPATLAGARGVVGDVQDLSAATALVAAAGDDRGDEVPVPSVVSGLPALVTTAGDVSAAAADRAATAQVSASVLAGAVVLAVAVVGAGRRRGELRLHAALGQRPVDVGALVALEVLPAALVGAAAGAALVTLGVVLGGPDGPVTAAGLLLGAGRAVLAALAGTLLVAATSAVAAGLAARRGRGGAARRPPSWVPLLVVVAATAAVGVGAGRGGGGTASGLDLAVPVLVAGAVGALGGQLLRAALRRAPAAPSRPRLRRPDRSTADRPAPGRERASAPRAVVVLALRRVAGPGDDVLVVLVLVTAALGLLLHVVAGGSAVQRAVVDKTAVLAGAAVTAVLPDAGRIDPTLPRAGEGAPRDPLLPAGETVVWRDEVRLDGRPGLRALLAVDPAGLDAAAAWGATDAVGEARRALRELARAEPDGAGRLLPVVLAGPTSLRPGDLTSITDDVGTAAGRVVAVVPTFPGQGAEQLLVITTTDAFLPRQLPDPRTLAEGAPRASGVQAQLWSSRPASAVSSELRALGVDADLRTQDEVGQRPDLAAVALVRGYVLAVALAVALVALVAVCLAAERSTTRARAADLLLTRAGMGRRGPLAAHLLQTGLVLLAALLLALAATAALRPLAVALLDPSPGLAPELQPALTPAAVIAAVAAVAVSWTAAAAVAAMTSRAPVEEVLRSGG